MPVSLLFSSMNGEKSAVEAESSLGMSGVWPWACGDQGWGWGWGGREGRTMPFTRWMTVGGGSQLSASG